MQAEDHVSGPVPASQRGRDQKHRQDEPERLVCMKDNVKIPRDDPRCLYPTSQCRFREFCPVMDLVRARRRKLNSPDVTPARSPAEDGEAAEGGRESD